MRTTSLTPNDRSPHRDSNEETSQLTDQTKTSPIKNGLRRLQP